MTSIYFYIPQNDWPSEQIPDFQAIEDLGIYLQRLCGVTTIYSTIYCWTLQTYLWLKFHDFPCSLVGNLPQEGIVITYWDSIPNDFKPSPKLLILGILADGVYPHPFAQLRVVQNRVQLKFSNSYYIPLWPQPGLIPRSFDRTHKFENVAFFGDIANLAPELKSLSWQDKLQSLGLNWCVMKPNSWHDYSNIDAVLAVRGFEKHDYFNKPATKLYNCWHAGVPAILGRESAFQAERKSELDFIEVSSPEDILSALQRLHDSKELRQAMIENGWARAKETSVKNITTQWRNFITQVAIPAYEVWCSSSYLTRQSFFAKRYLSKKSNGLQYRSKKVFSFLQK